VTVTAETLKNYLALSRPAFLSLIFASISLATALLAIPRSIAVSPLPPAYKTILRGRAGGHNWSFTVPFQIHNVNAIEALISCESQGVNISKPDSDGVASDGILQFHRAKSTPALIGSGTWAWMASSSGIKGTPIWPTDAIKMTDWAISHNLGSQWSCWHIAGLDQL
jgi:hypothetical protein